MASPIGELVMRCFHARTNAHVLHLKTKSYSTHVALSEFYDAIVDLTDSLAEAYQGDYGLIEAPPMKYTYVDDPLTLVKELGKWIADNRYSVCDEDDTYLQNLIDEIMAQIRSSEYKLRFLK
jgi:hypothetical protein